MYYFFISRHNYSDASKNEVSSEDGNKACSNEGAAGDEAQLYDNFDPGVSIGEASVERPSEHLKFAIELPRTLKYDCGSPDCDPTPRCGTQMDSVSELAGTSASIVPFAKETSRKISPEDEVHLQGIHQIEQKKETSECDWESLISDAADLLIFSSPIDTEAFKGLIQKSLDPGAGFCTSEVHKMRVVGPSSSVEQHEMEDPFAQPGETMELKQINQRQDNLAANNMPNNCTTSNPSEKANDEVGTAIAFTCKVKMQVVSMVNICCISCTPLKFMK